VSARTEINDAESIVPEFNAEFPIDEDSSIIRPTMLHRGEHTTNGGLINGQVAANAGNRTHFIRQERLESQFAL
jgi:hypothetical protein